MTARLNKHSPSQAAVDVHFRSKRISLLILEEEIDFFFQNNQRIWNGMWKVSFINSLWARVKQIDTGNINQVFWSNKSKFWERGVWNHLHNFTFQDPKGQPLSNTRQCSLQPTFLNVFTTYLELKGNLGSFFRVYLDSGHSSADGILTVWFLLDVCLYWIPMVLGVRKH